MAKWLSLVIISISLLISHHISLTELIQIQNFTEPNIAQMKKLQFQIKSQDAHKNHNVSLLAEHT